MGDRLSEKFAALADPTRRAMLARLAHAELTLSELAKPLDMTVPAVAKHLAVLERAGFVARKRKRKSVARPARLQVAALNEMASWIERCRAHWEGSFDRLADYLEKADDEGKRSGRRDATRKPRERGSTDVGRAHEVRLTREFSAPRDRVWLAWTRPEALLRLLGPTHCPAVEVTADVREGGAWRACLKMSGEDGSVLWQSGRYRVVMPPERLEFTFRWEGSAHEDGPGVETHVIVLLEELAHGGTRMHFRQTGLVSANSAVGHSSGWGSTFDRLSENLLAQDEPVGPGE